MPVLSPWQVVEKEMTLYLSHPNINPDDDPLMWWKK